MLIRGGPLDERGRPAEGFDGEIVPDSGKITEWAEEHFPNPSLKPRSEEEASLGGPLFKLMKEFVFADPKDSEAQVKGAKLKGGGLRGSGEGAKAPV